MKLFSERFPGEYRRKSRGYLAPCEKCGLIVVHASGTGQPFHMHRKSKRCRELAKKRST